MERLCVAPISDTETLVAGGSFMGESSLKAWIYKWDSTTGPWKETTELPEPLDVQRGSYCSQLNSNGDVITGSGLIYRAQSKSWEKYEYDGFLNGPIFYIKEFNNAGLIDSNKPEVRGSAITHYKFYVFKDGRWTDSGIELPKLPFEYLISTVDINTIPSCKDN